MQNTSPLKDIELLVKSHFGLIYLDTAEDDRVDALLRHLAESMAMGYFTWSSTKGLQRLDGDGRIYGSENLAQALGHVEQSSYSALYFFQGLGSHLEDKNIVQKLKDVADSLSKKRAAVLITGLNLTFPDALTSLYTRVKLPPPDIEDFRKLLQHVLRDLSARTRVVNELTADDTTRLLNNMKGLTLMEARKVLTRVIIEEDKFSPEDIKKVVDAKRQLIEQDGLLEYYPLEESIAGIAGMEGLKAWLDKRKEIVMNPEKAVSFGLTFPKGILLLGVQGCGKSLCAKAVAMEWSLPLLKFDTSSLYNKYIGETEKNFNKAVKMAERMAPVILWIDEIEKAFASGGEEDGGVSKRLLGSFLTWMQERKGDVFVIATANDIEKLPPEFLRKGRFDEIFFVDLPTVEARHEVFEIHFKKRRRDPKQFDLPLLVKATEGFSGAEIEQVIVSGLYTAFSAQQDLNSDILMREILQTRPLSVTMREKITKLREWASSRTVSAN